MHGQTVTVHWPVCHSQLESGYRVDGPSLDQNWRRRTASRAGDRPRGRMAEAGSPGTTRRLIPIKARVPERSDRARWRAWADDARSLK